MLPILGNHDGFPVDNFNFTEHNWILSYTSNFLKFWLNENALDSYKKYGFYSENIGSARNLKIIALNIFSGISTNRFLWGNQSNPGVQLDFLETELLKAEKNNQKVLVFGHQSPDTINFNPRIFIY